MNDKPRLIDAGALSFKIYKRINQMTLENEELTAYDALIEAMKLIGKAPTIDAEPVVHGRWIYKGFVGDYDYLSCSYCGEMVRANIDNKKYCPNCGAKMDLEEEK